MGRDVSGAVRASGSSFLGHLAHQGSFGFRERGFVGDFVLAVFGLVSAFPAFETSSRVSEEGEVFVVESGSVFFGFSCVVSREEVALGVPWLEGCGFFCFVPISVVGFVSFPVFK